MLARTKSHDWQTLARLKFPPSRYQVGLFEWSTNQRNRHGAVNAVAGSGKSTALEAVVRLVPGVGLAVAFNVPIAKALGERLEGTGWASRTVNSHGSAAVHWGLRGSKLVFNKHKYADMIRDAAEAAKVNRSLCGVPLTDAQAKIVCAEDADGFPVNTCKHLVNLARLDLLDMDAEDFAEQLATLAARHELLGDDQCLWPLIVSVVQNCLWIGCDAPRVGERRVFEIDYTDQIWLPTVLGLRPKQYDWVLVDECQDISTAARKLLMASVTPRGRLLWVGDPRQAIYGFAGADSGSFDAIVRECNADIIPLSVCYRCPTSHLDIARQWCPEIEARPGAPEGIVRTAKRANYVGEAKPGDLVICRRNAPLVDLAFELIAAGRPALVRGRSIGDGLARTVKAATKLTQGEWSSGFGQGLDAWVKAELEAARKRYKDDEFAEVADRIMDRSECVWVVWGRSAAKSAAELLQAIDGLFSDDNKDSMVILSSVHRAKGSEADRVAILEPENLQSRHATQPWQIQQEQNLAYVAYTRSRHELIEIPGERR